MEPSGLRVRRKGIDFEAGYQGITERLNNVDVKNRAISTYFWDQVADRVGLSFSCVQVGNVLKIFSNDDIVLSDELLIELPLGLSMTTEFSYTSIDGDLIIANGTSQIYRVTYDVDTEDFDLEAFQLRVRDQWGITDPGLEEGNEVAVRPTDLTTPHLYNLRNQGWGLERAVAIGGGDSYLQDPLHEIEKKTYDGEVYGQYPSNADIRHEWERPQPESADQHTAFFIDDFVANPPHPTRAPQGYFVIDAMERGASRRLEYIANMDRNPNLEDTINTGEVPEDYTPGGASVVSEYAGRVFYAGFSGEVKDGDDNSPRLSSYVMYSQLVNSPSDLPNCYQAGDPTSPEVSDLIATDGGVIRISGAERIIGLLPIRRSLFVIATNGIWEISGGSDAGFSATNFEVDRVTDQGMLTPNTLVAMDDSFMYWSLEGIFAVARNSIGDWQVQSMSAATIQGFYDSIPVESRGRAKAIYDRSELKVRWLYPVVNGGMLLETYAELVYDVKLNAFYPYRFEDVDSGSPKALDYMPYRLNAVTEVTEPIQAQGNQVTVNSQDVGWDDSYVASSEVRFKYLTFFTSTGGGAEPVTLLLCDEIIDTVEFKGTPNEVGPDAVHPVYIGWGEATVTTDPLIKKFGGGSLRVQGTNGNNASCTPVKVNYRADGATRPIIGSLSYSWTVQAWVKFDTAAKGHFQSVAANYPSMAEFGNSQFGWAMCLGISSTGQIGTWHREVGFDSGTTVLANDTWYKFEFGYHKDTKQVYCFVNGSLELTADWTAISGLMDRPLYIGSTGYFGGTGGDPQNTMVGYIDELAVYDDVLNVSSFPHEEDSILSAKWDFTFSELNNDSFRDWAAWDPAGVGADAEAWLETHPMTYGDSSRDKELPYLTWHMEKERTIRPSFNCIEQHPYDCVPQPKGQDCESGLNWMRFRKGTWSYGIFSTNKPLGETGDHDHTGQGHNWVYDGSFDGNVTHDYEASLEDQPTDQCLENMNYWRNNNGSHNILISIGSDNSNTKFGWWGGGCWVRIREHSSQTGRQPLCSLASRRSTGIAMMYNPDNRKVTFANGQDPITGAFTPETDIGWTMPEITDYEWVYVGIMRNYQTGDAIFQMNDQIYSEYRGLDYIAGTSFPQNPPPDGRVQTHGIYFSIINFAEVNYRHEFNIRSGWTGLPSEVIAPGGDGGGHSVTEAWEFSKDWGGTAEDLIATMQDTYTEMLRSKFAYSVPAFGSDEYVEFGSGWRDVDSSCMVNAKWDHADSYGTRRTGRPFQVYRPEVRNQSDGTSVVTTRNRVRGRGGAFSIRANTEADKACRILGWNYALTGNKYV